MSNSQLGVKGRFASQGMDLSRPLPFHEVCYGTRHRTLYLDGKSLSPMKSVSTDVRLIKEVCDMAPLADFPFLALLNSMVILPES